MANHKKSPIFLRISTSNNVVCVNPHQLSSFQIIEKAKIRVMKGTFERAARGATPEQVETITADTVALFFPAGTTMQFTVGIEITQEEFQYVCSTLIEFLYLNEYEWRAKSEAIEKAKIAEWNKAMAPESIDK